ncbi:hypothetical protein HN789_01435 [archaeon]|jgi:hypothetical protein|nr:hypothetical protein [archaeon]MBT4022194.1 hypothetical protein [archaeon]MBT4272807.1 hypothetical protein [archaeon]MBT4461606.1 hypothetical protein [archaeon]MBT4857626.1 hypothetical protein [archaeon]
MIFNITNMIGLVSFSSVLILIFFYLMRPKPFKKVIPSLIFLESSKKKKNMTSFFKRFVKDWIFFLQLLILVVLCLGTLGITTDLMIKKVNKDITFVIDASASSKSYDEGKMLFSRYLDIAKKQIGVRNTVILIKNTPEVVATRTNPLNTFRILASIKPTDSLSNVWDSMMLASEISEGKIIVLSDFSDSNSKDVSTAKQLLEAKGFEVELINPRKSELSNVGIINYKLSGEKAIVDVKNFDNYEKTITLNSKKIVLDGNSVEQVQIDLTPGLNKIIIETKDSLESDNELNIMIPKESEKKVLFITNKKKNNLYDAITSMKFLDVKKAQPPIIPDGDFDLYVLSDVDYSTLLPGTIDKIKAKVKKGATIIIAAQEKLPQLDILPINIFNEKTTDITIFNNRFIGFEDFNFGLSSKYLEAGLKDNSSIILAQTNDKLGSPIIVVSTHGSGKILYYGIIDEYNSFKISTQYPLFWINSLEYLISKQDYSTVNKKIGEVLHGEIKDPDNKKLNDYITTEKVGVYEVNNEEIAVNLVNIKESTLNKKIEFESSESDYEQVKILQTIPLMSLILFIGTLLVLFELYLIKKRGDI